MIVKSANAIVNAAKTANAIVKIARVAKTGNVNAKTANANVHVVSNIFNCPLYPPSLKEGFWDVLFDKELLGRY